MPSAGTPQRPSRPAPDTPHLAIAVPCHNRARHLARLLDALAAQREIGAVAAIVCCDDGSEPPLALSLIEATHVRVVRHPRSCGPAAARNSAWRSVEAEWVWFLDDDVVPEPGAVAAMLAAVSAAPADVGIIEGPVRSQAAPETRVANPLALKLPDSDGPHRLTANVAYRRAALEGVGGFDEGFPAAACEDFDLAFRVEDAGWRHGAAAGVVRHAVHPPMGVGPWFRRRRVARAAVVRLYRRHPGRFGPAWLARFGALIHRPGTSPGAATFLRFFVAEAILDVVAARTHWRHPLLLALTALLAVGVVVGSVRDYVSGAYDAASLG